MLALWAVLILLEVKATVRRCGRVYLLLRRYFGVGSGSDAVFTDIHSGLAGSCCFKLIWFEMVKPICGPPLPPPKLSWRRHVACIQLQQQLKLRSASGNLQSES